VKRTVAVIMLCSLIVCLCSCSAPLFESRDAMNDCLDGLWVTNGSDGNNYLFFQDGQMYRTSDDSFADEMESIMDAILEEEGLNGLLQLDFEAALQLVSTDNVLRLRKENIDFDQKSGKVVLDKGQSFERHIIIGDGTLTERYASQNYGGDVYKKLSEQVDFSDAHFEEVFTKAKENYEIPTSMLWTSIEEYAAFIKANKPEIGGWILTSNKDNTIVYEDNGLVPQIDGFFAITDKDVIFNSRTTLYSNWKPSFFVNYNPFEHGRITVLDTDNMSLDVKLLCQYIAYALKGFPGAMDATELHEMLVSEEGVIDNGKLFVEKEFNGIHYQFEAGTNGTWANISAAVVDETITLADCLQHGQENPGDSPTLPEEETATVPPATEVVTTPRCEHAFNQATCTLPKTCTICGQTEGEALGHSYSAATCTSPKTCSACGETNGSAAGHQWKEATCTSPAICTACRKESGEPNGHTMRATKCIDCDHSDFSAFAKNYSEVGAYDHKTGADLEVTNVSISQSGTLTFTFMEKTYAVNLEQKSFDAYDAYFNGYRNGVLEPDLEASVRLLGDRYVFHFKWVLLDGYRLYFFIDG